MTAIAPVRFFKKTPVALINCAQYLPKYNIYNKYIKHLILFTEIINSRNFPSSAQMPNKMARSAHTSTY
ncbi:hypothetical protein [Escherichia coli]|uniref:hypothetical protein n=1 Tax=Escherichia coli TaxID=562 RepID=UPI001B7D7C18|nr:hypothetical protein [Escherichia coli]